MNKKLNDELRERSGTVTDDRPLVEFIYGLIRDHLSAGQVEDLIRQLTAPQKTVVYTNGFIAKYAQDVANRLAPELNLAPRRKDEQIWWCKIGGRTKVPVEQGGDLHMRLVVIKEFEELTNTKPEYIFSGWNGQLTEEQRLSVDACRAAIKGSQNG